MRHLTDITKEPWFWEKPWLLLGTGPSLDTFNPEEHRDKNICAIYAAANVCGLVDLHLMADDGCFRDGIADITRSRYIATRSVNAPIHETNPNVVYWEYDCDVQHRFQGKAMMPNPLYPCSCTSSFIVMFFGMIGIRELYTCGIDGGNTYSKKMPQDYLRANIGSNPDLENEGVYGHAKSYGIELIRV